MVSELDLNKIAVSRNVENVKTNEQKAQHSLTAYES